MPLFRLAQLVFAVVILVVESFSRSVVYFFRRFLPTSWDDRIREFFGTTSERGEYILDVNELVTRNGYPFEAHTVITADGYVLQLHRIPHSREESSRPANRPVVLLQHGMLMCSEVWVSNGASQSLAFYLADAGYDVWLGNNRGNKYAYKHLRLSPHTEAFWDFSIDDFALYDMPAMINHICRISNVPAISIIGFSQGTAQTFAMLASNYETAQKVSCFIALSPVTAISKRAFNSIVNTVARSRPEMVYLLFGRKSLLPAALFWKENLPVWLFVRVIDNCVKLLFNWDTRHIPQKHKALAYQYLYSHTSVKALVHWFQIARSGEFQMFSDCERYYGKDSYSRHTPPVYAIERITTPLSIFFGNADFLFDRSVLLEKLPKSATVEAVEGFEHMDFLYSDISRQTIYPKLTQILNQHANHKSPPANI
eukprot:GILK01003248.1.p1 GENE.GILK01003248.1~~GILK01003248.1.p1  ORF type:complete len:425 (-),score=52.94 GILK01003248.1:113-1387(-)